jgi:hypothetical protein
MNQMQPGWLLGVAVALAGTGVARAGDVTVQLSSREAYVGQPVRVQVIIRDAESHELPEPPDVDGADIRMIAGPQTSSRTTIINGRMSQEKTVAYVFAVTPERAGTIRIPPFSVKVDGQSRKTEPIVLVAVQSETGDLLFVEVEGSRDSVYVGESLELVLKVWVRPYTDQALGIRLTEDDVWSLVDEETSRWGVFGDSLMDMLRRRVRPRGREVLRADSEGADRGYYLYEVRTTVWPERPGPVDVGDLRVVVKYPLGLRRDRGLFGDQYRLTDARPVQASPAVPRIDVKAVPTEGRPAFFRGAVEPYTLTVEARPTEVRVGDPITLTMTLRGKGRLDLLQAPALTEVPELTSQFQVPDEVLAGSVQGNSKVFTQSIRAKSESVTEVPPIPFAYFDTKKERFVVVRSRAIPLKVGPGQRMAVSEVVEARPGLAAPTHLTEVSGGIVANYYGSVDLLADHSFAPGPASLAVVAAPPVLFGVLWAGRRRKERLRTDRSYARRRSARRNASRALAAAQDGAGAQAADAVAGALIGYVADRCNLPAAGLTRTDAVEALLQRGVRTDVADRVDALLRRCDDARYAGRGVDTGDSLVARAEECIRELERQSF